MLPIERQQQILTWLKKEETLRVAEISKRLGVSEMTIYRDLKPLIDEQKILKTSNGITLLPTAYVSTASCSYCLKNTNTRLSVQLIRHNHQVERTCCAHCGLLRYRDIESEVSQIICQDYLKDTTISAKMAVFLIGAELNLNCCQPQVITFDSSQQAKQFQAGFGGRLCSFEEAIQVIQTLMNATACCPSESS